MSLNLYNIKKWTKMIFGKSLMHVNQDCGKLYKKNHISGYYNDLTNKVILDKENYNNIDVFPHKSLTYDGTVQDVFFPIAIFQYGLGAYDLFLKNNDELMYEKFIKHADWALTNQNIDGSWDNFGFIEPTAKFSSMAQGEGCSLLLRAYQSTKNKKYLNAAKKAIYFMIKPLEESGTLKRNGDNIYLYEFTNRPIVLNGWIFSIFGLYDYLLVDHNDKTIEKIYKTTIFTLKNELPKFDLGYWSKYDINNRIASPFYHNLHIALLKTLGDLTNETIFIDYAIKFENYSKNPFFSFLAFTKKVYQKLKEK